MAIEQELKSQKYSGSLFPARTEQIGLAPLGRLGGEERDKEAHLDRRADLLGRSPRRLASPTRLLCRSRSLPRAWCGDWRDEKTSEAAKKTRAVSCEEEEQKKGSVRPTGLDRVYWA